MSHLLQISARSSNWHRMPCLCISLYDKLMYNNCIVTSFFPFQAP